MTAPLDPFAPLRRLLVQSYPVVYPEQEALLARLLREHEERTADAERFVWIRDHAQSGLVPSGDKTVHRWMFDLPYRMGVSTDWLRGGIDAARSPHQEPTEP